MYNNIILSSYLFGSFYLFSKSLTLTNMRLLEDNKMPNELFIINDLSILVFGFIVVYNFNLLNSCHFYKFKKS